MTRIATFILSAALWTLTAFAAVGQTATPTHRAEVVKAYPHDRQAFTQGLIFRDGQLFESTGRYPSTIRRVRLEDGVAVQKVELPCDCFGEGIVDWDDRLISLTWRNGGGFV